MQAIALRVHRHELRYSPLSRVLHTREAAVLLALRFEADDVEIALQERGAPHTPMDGSAARTLISSPLCSQDGSSKLRVTRGTMCFARERDGLTTLLCEKQDGSVVQLLLHRARATDSLPELLSGMGVAEVKAEPKRGGKRRK